MLWDKLTEENYIIYVNRDIDLKIKVFELMENDEIYINYKGFNLTIPMLVWEFGEDLKLASIEDVRMEGNDRFDKHFVIKKEDKEKFLDEIYFFLVFTFGQYCLGRIYLIGIAVLYPVAIGIAPRWVGWVLTGCRIEQRLGIEYIVVAKG